MWSSSPHYSAIQPASVTVPLLAQRPCGTRRQQTGYRHSETTTLDGQTPVLADTFGEPATGGGAAEAAFVNALENIFVQIRGRGVQWSPEDRERALKWRNIGVSLPRIVTVIEKRAKAWRFLHGDAADLPIRLRFYEKAVLGGASHSWRVSAVQPTVSPAQPHDASDDHANFEHANFEHDGFGESDGDNEESYADRLCRLLDRVPDLVGGSDDPALHRAYRQAGMSLARSLKGDAKDCADGIGPDGLHGAVQRARRVIRETLLKGIGTHAATALTDVVDGKLAREGGSARAMKSRRIALIEASLQCDFGVRFPTVDGWSSAEGNEDP